MHKVGCFSLQTLKVPRDGECQCAEYCPEGKSVELEGHPERPQERKRDCVRSVNSVRPVCTE